MSHLLRSSLPLLVLCLTGCLQIPELEPGSTPDAGPQDDNAPIDIEWVSPAPNSLSNGFVPLHVTLTGRTPDLVELLVDGQFGTLLASPYSTLWNTGAISEGTHILSVRAHRLGRTFVSSSRVLTVDRTPPRMLTQSPAQGASAVSVKQAIQATLSEPLASSTVSPQSIRLLANTGQLDADVLLSGDGKALSLVPHAPLPANSAIRVSIGDSVTDLAGNSMEASFREWIWHVPAYLLLGEPLTSEPTNPNIGNVSLGVGADAQPIIAWIEGWGEPFKVHVKRWTGAAWDYIGIPLAANSAVNAVECTLNVDAAGVPTVMWREYLEGNAQQWGSRRWNGHAWTQLGPAVTPVLQNARIGGWQFAQGTAGYATIAIDESNEAQHQLTIRQWNGSAWLAVGGGISLRKGSTINFLRMEVDAQGHPFLTWLESGEGDAADIRSAMRWTGTVWQSISATLKEAPTALALDASGTPYVGALEIVSGQLRVFVKRWNGSAWVNLGDAFESVAGSMLRYVSAIRFDASGRPTVALYAQRATSPGPTAVAQVLRWNGAQWEAVVGMLDATPGLIASNPALLGITSAGDPFMAWVEGPPEAFSPGSRIYVYRPND
ncbi:Ig-like domain-containing protein [Corallococcus sp. bb12-1]|uniref:Ig-like domain-containing protein n=1 Tax=Corallococcus sp. bb12-1 TaxID=2996784 RepID=UPI00226DC286|nr:Ig-like domain-containing protein [Corallococcus sp. bb12-1]MCY1046586.1 Ig-like domain-containing protein [Corallococcus sp. bb12-1]